MGWRRIVANSGFEKMRSTSLLARLMVSMDYFSTEEADYEECWRVKI